MRARGVAAAVVALLVLSACSERLDPVGEGPPGDIDAPRVDATVEGTVTNLAGAPVAGAAIEVRSRPSAGEETNAYLAFFFTAGFACFAGACNPATAASQTTTGPDGRFRATLPKAHLPGYETDTDWFVTASRPPPPGHVVGATSGDEFEVAAAVQRPPALPLWMASPTLTVSEDAVTTTWDQIDPDVFESGEIRYSLAFLDGRRAPVWRVRLARPGDRLDPRLLEDTRGSVAVAVRGDVTVGETIYHRTVAAPQPALVGPAGAPPSRNAVCQIEENPTPAPCWLTDGDLAATAPARVRSVVVTVPEMRTDLVVLRGCGSCTVELSTDGTTWRTLDVDSDTGLAVLPPTTPVRLVRVRGDMALQSATELSVWPARPAPASAPTPAGTGLLPRDDDTDDRNWVLLAVAGLLLAGAIVLLVRRRTRAPRP